MAVLILLFVLIFVKADVYADDSTSVDVTDIDVNSTVASYNIANA